MSDRSIAIFALIAAFIMPFVVEGISYLRESYLQERAQAATYASEVTKVRVGIVSDATAVFAEGRRLALHYSASDEAARSEFARIVTCVIDRARQTDGVTCASIAPKFNDERLKEATALQARFETVVALAGHWFCDGTRHALKKLPVGGFWWNGEDDARKIVINTMNGELFCEFPRWEK